MSLLQVQDLSIELSDPADSGLAPLAAVIGVSFAVDRGEAVGLVGESGCGKTLTALALLRLLPAAGSITAGRILLDGENLLERSESGMRAIRGRRIGMVFQDPSAALNPVFSLGFQLIETIRVHRPMSKRAARAEAQRLLELVSMPDAADRLRSYPHQLSGGQQQRATIALALAGEPDLLIADEPTTALDVTVQAQILALLERLRQELGLAVLLITHDLAVVAETCERALVMYSGRLVEEAGVEDLFARPAHPYARGLLAALPRPGVRVARGQLPTIAGSVPEPRSRPGGCAFHPRCPEVLPRCTEAVPDWLPVRAGQSARCVLYGEREA